MVLRGPLSRANKEQRTKNKEIAHHNLFSVLYSLFWLLNTPRYPLNAPSGLPRRTMSWQ